MQGGNSDYGAQTETEKAASRSLDLENAKKEEDARLKKCSVLGLSNCSSKNQYGQFIFDEQGLTILTNFKILPDPEILQMINSLTQEQLLKFRKEFGDQVYYDRTLTKDNIKESIAAIKKQSSEEAEAKEISKEFPRIADLYWNDFRILKYAKEQQEKNPDATKLLEEYKKIEGWLTFLNTKLKETPQADITDIISEFRERPEIKEYYAEQDNIKTFREQNEQFKACAEKWNDEYNKQSEKLKGTKGRTQGQPCGKSKVLGMLGKDNCLNPLKCKEMYYRVSDKETAVVNQCRSKDDPTTTLKDFDVGCIRPKFVSKITQNVSSSNTSHQ